MESLSPSMSPQLHRSGYRGPLRVATATEAKNGFGQLLATLHQGAIAITSHESPKAVLMSIEEFLALVGAGERQLDTLSAEFDALLDTLQTPKVKAGIQHAFEASTDALGEAAVAAIKRHE